MQVQIRNVFSAFVLLALVSCAANPFRTAQTAEQRGDALYGEYVIAKEVGVALLNDAAIPDTAKRPVAEAMVASAPVANKLQDALIAYAQVRAQLAEGATSQEKLEIAERNLAMWLAQAQPLVTDLITIVGGHAK